MISIEEQKRRGRDIVASKYWSMWDGFVELMYPAVNMLDVCCVLPVIKALNDGCSFETVKGVYITNCKDNKNITYSLPNLCDRGQAFMMWFLKND